MKPTLRTFLVIVMIMPGTYANNAAGKGESEKASPFFVNTDLVSRYVWRGTDIGYGLQIQSAGIRGYYPESEQGTD